MLHTNYIKNSILPSWYFCSLTSFQLNKRPEFLVGYRRGSWCLTKFFTKVGLRTYFCWQALFYASIITNIETRVIPLPFSAGRVEITSFLRGHNLGRINLSSETGGGVPFFGFVLTSKYAQTKFSFHLFFFYFLTKKNNEKKRCPQTQA